MNALNASWYKSVIPWTSAGVWVCTLRAVFPRAPLLGIHKTALRVQNPHTLDAHGTTITRISAGLNTEGTRLGISESL